MGKKSKVRQGKEMVRSVHSKEATVGEYGDEMQVVQAAYMCIPRYIPPLVSPDQGCTSQVTKATACTASQHFSLGGIPFEAPLRSPRPYVAGAV